MSMEEYFEPFYKQIDELHTLLEESQATIKSLLEIASIAAFYAAGELGENLDKVNADIQSAKQVQEKIAQKLTKEATEADILKRLHVNSRWS